MAMVDATFVMDAIVAVSIAAGAAFAVLELRSMSKDRKTELLMRIAEFTCRLEFEEAGARFVKANFQTPEEAEEQLSLPVLMMLADYNDFLGTLAKNELVPKDAILDTFDFEYAWEKIKVWARSPNAADQDGERRGPSYPYFEWLAGEARERRLQRNKDGQGFSPRKRP
jgi:hypothetical protein